MNTAMPQRDLEKLLDIAVRNVTTKICGVRLCPGGSPPGGDFCTIYIAFRKEFRSSLTLRADTALLTEMTKQVYEMETVTAQDLEDFAKEYFNVLCGRISAIFFMSTKKPARFSVPSFYRGHFEPEGQRQQFVLNYSDGQNRSAQLIHHVPCEGPEKRIASEIS